MRGSVCDQIWKAVMALDLVKRRAIRTAERLLPGADLKTVLADPFFMEVCDKGSEVPAAAHLASTLAFLLPVNKMNPVTTHRDT